MARNWRTMFSVDHQCSRGARSATGPRGRAKVRRASGCVCGCHGRGCASRGCDCAPGTGGWGPWNCGGAPAGRVPATRGGRGGTGGHGCAPPGLDCAPGTGGWPPRDCGGAPAGRAPATLGERGGTGGQDREPCGPRGSCGRIRGSRASVGRTDPGGGASDAGDGCVVPPEAPSGALSGSSPRAMSVAGWPSVSRPGPRTVEGVSVRPVSEVVPSCFRGTCLTFDRASNTTFSMALRP